ncbi:MAG TPA: M14 family metallopeptidase [Parafilimonas sp.]|nr:M14 family metallopeptidase [Parafilimonas sp.]
MKKIFLAGCLLIFGFFVSAQNIPSPKEFLGYELGEHFTPQYKVVAYFNAVAQAASSMVKVQKYGETTEGRDMIAAFISSPQNIQNLENIRENNLRLADMLTDKAGDVNAPAIVWFSYNIHGNEPAGTEAAMKVLYALVDPNNAQSKQWLQNVVVVIDPCQNPDGRDRYVNWYNNAVGEHFNADPQSREHDEPWPYGRTNHYNFDMNRDWAWQTQKEMQQKLKLYNDWLPQVHVDLHEQEYDAPYYFAPAAQPYHEVITKWQRDFQTQIGKNNAKYFDANGWLYYTKQIYDLFYPSYGDTYPTYSGAIGMTYEQGGIDAGLGIKTSVGDTLTLADRVLHHYTASMSTIEISAANYQKLVSEFKTYFDNNLKGVDMEYKTYVLTSSDQNKIEAVKNLLDKNKITYGIPSGTNFSGYNYYTNKTSGFTSEGYDIAVTTMQPKGRLVKVLFEQQSKLVDSATYDITAWSIPYSYGLNAWAVKENLQLSAYNNPKPINETQSNYGLLIPYTSLNSAKVLANLLENNVHVRFSTNSFTYNGKTFERGTLIVLKGNNIASWSDVVNKACSTYNVQPYVVQTGFMDAGADFGSADVHFIKAPRVALLTGQNVSHTAAGEVWCFFDTELNYPVSQLITEHLGYMNLSNYDVLIMPDGNYNALDENKDLADKLEAFVKDGGKIIATEGGAAKLASMDWTGIKLEKDSTQNSDSIVQKNYADAERQSLTTFTPGAIYKIQLDNTHPLGYGYPDYYFTLKQDARTYTNFKDGWNVGILPSNAYVAGFVGSKVKPEMMQGVLIGDKRYGNGHIIIMNEDPLFRLFWQNGKLMFANAVFMAGN